MFGFLKKEKRPYIVETVKEMNDKRADKAAEALINQMAKKGYKVDQIQKVKGLMVSITVTFVSSDQKE